MLSFLAGLVVRLLVRFRAYGRDRVPRRGGVLLVANRIGPLDRLLLRAACPRSVRILPDRGYDVAEVAAALDGGGCVLMFPEGAVSGSGHLRAFGGELDAVLAATTKSVDVVPACLGGLWGGRWSQSPGQHTDAAGVMFGEPLPKATPAADLRLAVEVLRADLALKLSDFTPLVHQGFVRTMVSFRGLFRPAVIDYAAGEKTLTGGKLFVGAICVTSYLRGRVGDAPNVGVWLPTSLGGALANLAIAFLGRASVNLNYTAGAGAVASAARQAGLKVVVTSKRFLMRFPLELPDDIQRIYLEDVLAAVTKGQQTRTFLMALLLPAWVIERFVLGLHRHKTDDVLTIVFSSGSTGEPKGVVLTHRNIASNVDAAVRTIRIEPTDTLMGVLPFFHSFGYTVCLWAPLVAGAAVVYSPDPRAAKDVGAIVKKHAVSILLSTATFLRLYLRRCEPDDFRSIRLLICGAEKLPVKLQDEFHARLGVLPMEGYGCTELSPVVSTNLPAVTVGGETQECNTRGTVGRPVVGVAVRAFTQEEREPLPPGTEGVLCAKGPNVMAGYLHQPEKTKEAVRDGWYNTGDVGLVRADGFIQITGRVSRFAKIGGEMVPLERLEDELHDLYGGTDRVLTVTAVPDEKRGERLVVLVVPEAAGGIGALLGQLRARGLPNLWVPDARDCYTVEALPTLGSGKLDLKRVGELARELAKV
ncbi:AMP-binding protein [Urbifossiella limnaea]|uniref:Bifunctional protein Aas n=1 Tax=Urbifossiella limnaea TaxID=2528023 RepID=A0A517XPX4_9BACT|nr:AMP-binding protein [Urbifossiella limnaea]QDU19561.1 Bifunctional protein Aas [Urbifossiella limnaea]